MHPELLRLSLLGHSRVIYSYPVLVGLGAILALALSTRLARRDGVAAWDTLSVGLLACAGGLVGSVILDGALHLAEYWRARELPGLVFYGGLVGGAAASSLFIWRYRLPFGAIGDAAAPSLALAHAVGRLGCFCGGCCFGRPASPPWPGVVFRHPTSPAFQIAGGIQALHPVQLYEAAGLLTIAILLLVARRWPRWRGRVFLLYLASYALLRLGTETLRGDPGRGECCGLSTSQILSVAALAVVGAALLMTARRSRAEASAQKSRA